MSEFVIEIRVDDPAPDTDRLDASALAVLETAVTVTLQHHKTASPATLTLLLTDDAPIRRLNRDYLGKDKPTDMLSFPAGDPMPGMETAPSYLGDIVISVPFAERQAGAGGHSLLAELQLLAVHGALHLLGYDHAGPEEKERMWGAQTAVLAQLGLSNIAPTET